MVPILLSLAGVSRADDSRPLLLRDVGIDQRLGAQVPLDDVLHDEQGRDVRLREYFDGRPVVLSLAYFNCPMLCPYALNGLVNALNELPFAAGREFNILTVSFDSRDTPDAARRAKATYAGRYVRKGPEDAWHFLTGSDASIRSLTGRIGFRYAFDPATGQYAHASGLFLLTPSGQVARYFYGIDYPARDLRLSLVEASRGRIGSPTDQLLLFCYHYDPQTGKYSLYASRLMSLGGAATVVALGALVVILRRRESSPAS